MNDTLYEYYGRQKNDMESSAVPFLIFQMLNENELKVVLISDGICRLFKGDRSQIRYVLENDIVTTVHPEDAEKIATVWKQFLKEHNEFDAVFRKQIQNEFRSIHVCGDSHLTDTGERLYVVWCSDVTDVVNAEKINTYYDKLTGLPNMTSFGIFAEQERARMKNRGIVPAFVYFDIRDMKAINEKHGFAKGNGILAGTAFVLKDVFGKDAIARFSDDHFVVLTQKRHLEQKIEQVNDQILRNPMGIPVQVCAGIFMDDRKEYDIFSSVDRARLACRSIKKDYARRYRVFDRDMFNEYHQRRHILTHFDEALENGYIKLYYQPIIRTITGKICDMEALARWIDPEKGMMPPSQFISVLEDNRLINKLDFYMLRRICENLAERKRQDMPLVPVSVNISRTNFEICDVFDEVLAIVNEFNIAHNLLTIEITESAFIKNRQFLENQINKFRESGFNVWMDDFGSEYSSLNTLQEYSFDLIKLDMRFMKNFSLTGKNHLILSDVISMISRLGVNTLAEGVQTKEQLHFLRDAGCDKVQGYLFSKPMSCEYFLKKSRNGLQYDDIKKSSYYDRIENTNLELPVTFDNYSGFFGDSTGIAAAVLEFHNAKFKILKANNAYKEFLEASGEDPEQIYSDYYDWEMDMTPQFQKIAKKCLQSRNPEMINDIINEKVEINARLINVAYDPHNDLGAILVIINRYDTPSPPLLP